MKELPPVANAQLLVGIDSHDDAGVFQLNEDTALIQTVDFFTPVVDDPFDYGQIAVANALSDIYAMGAKPLTALNIVGFPVATMDKKILGMILKGGWEKAREAGVLIIGGHSVKDPEIKYGLAVTAVSDPRKIVRNNTGQPGDRLILTKPLGTGVLTTALKNEKLPAELLEQVTRVMKQLNRTSSEIMLKHGVTACTDVTGFGFLGHLLEMVENQSVSARMNVETIPLLPDVLNFIEARQIPAGLKENLKFLQPFLAYPSGMDDRLLKALCDPQTSGGLLFSVPAARTEDCLKNLHQGGMRDAVEVGEFIEKRNKPLILV